MGLREDGVYVQIQAFSINREGDTIRQKINKREYYYHDMKECREEIQTLYKMRNSA